MDTLGFNGHISPKDPKVVAQLFSSFLTGLVSIIMSLYSVSGYLQATPSFEKPYIEIGYKSVGEALKECETLNQRELILPIKLPAMEFTHHLGRCVNDMENYNDEFQ